MNINILNVFRFVKRLLFIVCVFVCPLIFATNLTRNPYNIQSFMLTGASCLLIFMWGAKVAVLREVNLKFTRTDIIFFMFIVACSLSLGWNIMLSDQPAALWGEALRRGNILITNVLIAYIAAKSVKAYDPLEDKNNYLASAMVFIWGFGWLLYPTFKMQGVFDIYALLMWGTGFYLCIKCLRRFSIKGFCDIFIPVAALASFYGICQNMGFDIFWNIDISYEFGSRAVSTFGNPNFLSSYIIMFLPLVFMYFLKAKKQGETFYYFCVMMLCSAYMVISMTRSSWLGAAAGFALLFIFADFRRTLFAAKKRAVFIIICSALVFFLWPLQNRADYSSAAASRLKEVSFFSSLGDFTLGAPAEKFNQAYHQRLMMWTCGVEMFKDSPIFGQGWGSFQLKYAPCQGRLMFKYPDLQDLKTQANAAHNEFIEVLSQSGLLGFSLYILFFISGVFAFLRAYRKMDTKARMFYCALFAGAVAMLADNMLNVTMQTAILAFMFWFIMSSLVSAGVTRSTRKISIVTGVFLFIFCAVMALSLFKWQRNNLMSDIYDLKAAKEFSLEKYNSSISNMRKALKYSNNKVESYYLLVNAFIKTGNFENAKEVILSALKYFPNYYEFYFRRATINAAQGDSTAAIADLKEVLKLFPSYIPAVSVLSDMLGKEEALQTPENIEFLSKLSSILSYRTDLKLILARIYMGQGRYEAARKELLEAIKRDSFNIDLIESLSTVDKKLGIKNDIALEKAKEFSAFKYKLSVVPLPHGLGAKLQAINQKYPLDLNAAMLLGEYYYKTGSYKQAIDILEPMHRLYRDDTALNFALASSCTALGRERDAAFYLNVVLQRDPLNITAAQRMEKLKSVL